MPEPGTVAALAIVAAGAFKFSKKKESVQA
ncbi:PEP-CTERM sorting domain-containing protein [Oculatella sp. LEGE 06141]